MNCWEFMRCGREKGGRTQRNLGICPAYPHHGTHCARITGTLCGGEVQGAFALKLVSCMNCDFYNSEHYNINYRGIHSSVHAELNRCAAGTGSSRGDHRVSR